MKRIPLSRGEFAMVDDKDYPKLSKLKWTVLITKGLKYAVNFYGRRHRKMRFMHREIVKSSAKQKVDHKDGHGLNNRRRNLRRCSHVQNLWNRGPQRNNTSGFKGVSWSRTAQKWEARVTANGVQYFLGNFDSKISAVRAHRRKTRLLHGSFARFV